MTIDWTKPVETTEDPPRPVRVLSPHGPDEHYPIVFAIEGCRGIEIAKRNGEVLGEPPMHLRNVAPPKPEPVLREAWVNCYDPKRFDPGVHPTKDAAERYARSWREACLKVAWMSDGSPVPGEHSDLLQHQDESGRVDGHIITCVSGGGDYIGNFETGFPRSIELARMHDIGKTMKYVAAPVEAPHDGYSWVRYDVFEECKQQRDALRLDLESRILESNETRKVIAALTAERDKWKDNANDALDELKAANDRIVQMAPVVEATVVWERHFSAQASERLVGAVRAYLRGVSYPKKTVNEAAFSDMMEPVRLCETCRFLRGPMSKCNACIQQDLWEAK